MVDTDAVRFECLLCFFCAGNVETGKKEVVFSGHRKGIEGVVGHKGHVMGVAVSSDGKFLVSETISFVNVARYSHALVSLKAS